MNFMLYIFELKANINLFKRGQLKYNEYLF
jgi:hypothetical protein